LCRHICLARELGTMPPVTAEDEFVFALETVRATYGRQSANEKDLREIVAIEESRIADASVIVGLLEARIAASTPPFPADAVIPGAPTPIPFPTGNSGNPFNISDLIDGMLLPERRDVRKPAHG
jgi:hypothetical protein